MNWSEKKRRRARAAIGFAVSAMFANIGNAASTTWTHAGDGTWQTSANWNNGLPSSSADAIFNLANTYTVTETANSAANSVDLSAGSLTLALGTYQLSSTGTLSVISAAGQSATLNLTGSGTLQTAGGVYLGLNSSGSGQNSSGTLNQLAGNLVTTGSTNFYLGVGGSSGTYNLSGGGATIGQIIIVGNDGTGQLNAAGGSINSGELWLARNVGSAGTVTLANSSITTGLVYIGGSDTTSGGSGTLSINGGGFRHFVNYASAPGNFGSLLNRLGVSARFPR